MDGAEATDTPPAGSVNAIGSTSTKTSAQIDCVEGQGNNEVQLDEDDILSEQWRGSSLEEVYRHLNEFELDHVPPVKPSPDHAVLHHYPIRQSDDEPPRPLKLHHKWDALHVRMPCSPKSQYPVCAPDGTATIESRWQMIGQALLRPINNSMELQEAILSYNVKYENQWKFRALHRLFDEELDESETRVFFEDLLPRIIRLALRLPELVQAPIPLLKQGQNRSVTLTQEQVACLLANAFLCTFPRRNTLKRKSEYSSFPDINFNNLFQSNGSWVLEKLKCICHYFRRVCPTERDATNVPTGVVTFTRRSLQSSDMPNWAQSLAPLGSIPLHITSVGTIEDQGLGLLQVDFANKYLGGGVLGSGCVQEEIRFVICPELLISKLFTECLRPTETLIMVGAERFSNYSGYARTFEWAGNHEDCTPRDSSRRRQTHIVAIDALRFVQSSHQYREELMLRELNKAYVGFMHTLATPPPGIASGNWGCGAFGGDAQLKALLQLMACTVTGRPLVYYTFGNDALRDKLHSIQNFFIEEKVLVKDLWSVLRRFHQKDLEPTQLYDYVRARLKSSAASSSVHTEMNAARHLPSKHVSPQLPPAAASSNFNKSRDLFADSSSTDSGDIPPPMACTSVSVKTTPKRTLPRRMSSDDDATSALLLAAAELEASKSDAQSTAAGSPRSTQQKAGKTAPATPSRNRGGGGGRQRTLVEMLDQFYTGDANTTVDARNGQSQNHSRSKRQCQVPLTRHE